MSTSNSPFSVGSIKVDPARNQFTGTKTAVVEPRVMDLLSVLAQHEGQVVSRDQLEAEVWDGAVVSDSAVTWCISRLRKALSEAGADTDYIRTIPKRGYTLTAPVEIIKTRSDLNLRRPWTRWVLIAISIALATIALTLIIDRPSPQPSPLRSKFRPLTTFPGQEEMIAFSGDGRDLAFSHRPTAGENWDLYLSVTDEGAVFPVVDNNGQALPEMRPSQRLAPPVRLTSTPDDELFPAFSPDGRQIAFARCNAANCSLMLLTLKAASLEVERTQTVQDLAPNWRGRIAWGFGDQRLYYSDRGENGSYDVYKYDLYSGQRQRLMAGLAGDPGAQVVALSPGADQLAVAYRTEQQATEVRLIELATGQAEVVARYPFWFYSIAWGAQAESLYYNTEVAAIGRLDLASREASLAVERDSWIGYFSINPASGKAAMVQSPGVSSTIWVSNKDSNGRYSAPEPIITSTAVDQLPQFANTDDKIAFVSRRGGLPQIWVRDTDGSEAQLSDTHNFRNFQPLQWAPDDGAIVSMVDGVVGSLQLSPEGYRVHSDPNAWSANPSWSPDGATLYFSREVEGVWQLFATSAAADPGRAKQITEDGGFAAHAFAGAVWFTKRNTPGLWRLRADSTPEQVTSSLPAGTTNFVVAEGGVYFLGTRAEISGLLFHNFERDESTLVIEWPWGGHFSMNRDRSRALFTRRVREESSILFEQ